MIPQVKAVMAADPTLTEPMAIEHTIVEAVIDAALEAKCTIDVYDGEEITLRTSVDKAAILKYMFSTEQDSLIIRKEGQRGGQVVFVYGNGTAVISDCDDNSFINGLLVKAGELAEAIEAGEIMTESKEVARA